MVVRWPTLLLSFCLFKDVGFFSCSSFFLIIFFPMKITFLSKLISLRLQSSCTQCPHCSRDMEYLDVIFVKLIGPVCCVCDAAIITLLFSLDIGREPCRKLCNTVLSLMDVPSSWIRWNNYNLYLDWQYCLLYWYILIIIVSFIEF